MFQDVPLKNSKREIRNDHRWNELEDEHSYTLHYQISFKLAQIVETLHTKLNQKVRSDREISNHH